MAKEDGSSASVGATLTVELLSGKSIEVDQVALSEALQRHCGKTSLAPGPPPMFMALHHDHLAGGQVPVQTVVMPGAPSVPPGPCTG